MDFYFLIGKLGPVGIGRKYLHTREESWEVEEQAHLIEAVSPWQFPRSLWASLHPEFSSCEALSIVLTREVILIQQNTKIPQNLIFVWKLKQLKE